MSSSSSTAAAADAGAQPPNAQRKEYTLTAESELRLELETAAKGPAVELELVEGQAEMYGTELAQGHLYQLPAGTKAAVFAWKEAKVTVKGNTTVAYTSRETPMRAYINCHAALESLRQRAEQARASGPRVLVVGPENSGKATVTRILANYAARQHRVVTVVDLDPGKGMLSPPGSLAMATLMMPASVTADFVDARPLMWHFGHLQVNKNPKAYNLLAARMAQVLDARFTQDSAANSSGCIVNCPTLATAELLQLRAHFKCDAILVLDQERLLNELQQALEQEKVILAHGILQRVTVDFLQTLGVSVARLPKSGGVISRDAAARQKDRLLALHRYFYGYEPEHSLSPYSFDVPFPKLRIYKIGGLPMPQSFLPLGVKPPEHETQLTKVEEFASDLLHKICAVVAVDDKTIISEDNYKDVIQKQTLGYVVIQDRYAPRNTLKLLSPAPFPLPSLTLLVSEMNFAETF